LIKGRIFTQKHKILGIVGLMEIISNDIYYEVDRRNWESEIPPFPRTRKSTQGEGDRVQVVALGWMQRNHPVQVPVVTINYGTFARDFAGDSWS
jgi:hypothetical protein